MGGVKNKLLLDDGITDFVKTLLDLDRLAGNHAAVGIAKQAMEKGVDSLTDKKTNI